MADHSKIEWTDATWNPITGCSVHSAGCIHCYAMQLAGTRLKDHPTRKGLTREVNGNHVWTGEVRFNEQWLLQPLQWKRPRDIFVCAHADLFHKDVPDEWIDKIFAVMALAPQHRFQVLTKRSDRMRQYMESIDNGDGERLEGFRSALVEGMAQSIWHELTGDKTVDEWMAVHLPLKNVWLGVSVEDQKAANERIPDLLATPAAIRWLSCEPLLGPVDLGDLQEGLPSNTWLTWLDGLNWVVVGGESGRHARPMHPDWARSLRDQCAAAGVPFHFKQWGEWLTAKGLSGHLPIGHVFEDGFQMIRVGKKAAGRLLDGQAWDEMPLNG